MRLPKHIGIIPDGNRRWAQSKGMPKEMGYKNGINPGFCLFKLCEKVGISEITYYGFTVDNTKRPREQRIAFTNACMNSVDVLSKENASLLVVGNRDSKMFPEKLNYYTERKQFGSGGIKVNFLVNYSWQWDLGQIINRENIDTKNIMNNIASKNVSRVDLIIRWGGRRRLSGFLPVQSAYADFYVIDDYWPDFREEHFYEALEWYDKQDITLGG
ncbi:dihydroorotate dehydrogenase [Clostridium sp. DMHC 10]|uniref:polyprenyl diphosphate synthase n=1 Tax=Clostridium sp. DMHC 10 TaxID=747377 RepID=UPI00069F18C6|nr:polyprenyl diphosphate synthase [Clostridium sp. DMHC 10]KOF56385.1 dihydroorotate dehydrogenase [Clostridium sp. DMHC 10]